jgi:hypothetical protein
MPMTHLCCASCSSRTCGRHAQLVSARRPSKKLWYSKKILIWRIWLADTLPKVRVLGFWGVVSHVNSYLVQGEGAAAPASSTKTQHNGMCHLTRFAWWRQDLHAIELLRAHIGEWTMTRMLDYWWVMCFTGYRLNWNSWIWIPFPIDSDCTLLYA